MKILEFKIDGQTMTVEPYGRVVAGSKGYLRARFSFDPSWHGARKAVSFFEKDGTEHPVLMRVDECNVPDAVTDGSVFRVSVTGDSNGSRMSTNRVAIIQEVV